MNESTELREVKLSDPIMFGTEKIETLNFRKAKAKDFRDMPITPKVGDMLDIAAKLSSQPPSVIDMLSPKDMAEVMKIMGEFMGDGLETGSKL